MKTRLSSAVFYIPAALSLIFMLHLNWGVLRQSPYYDEMWKINIIAAPDTLTRMLSFDTPLPLLWTYLSKTNFLIIPTGFGFARLISGLWLAAAASLLAWSLSHPKPNWQFIAGAAFMALCGATQEVARNINPYSFELFYGVAIVSIATMPLIVTHHRLFAMAFLISVPLAGASALFVVPGTLLVLFARAPDRRVRVELIATGVLVAALSLLLYFLFYRVILLGQADLIEFWASHIVQFDPSTYITTLITLPRQVAGQITGMDSSSHSITIAICACIAVGYAQIWSSARFAAISMAGAVVVGLAVPFFAPFPLELAEHRRVHFGWLWIFYFCFAVGVAAVVRIILRRQIISAVGGCAALLAVLLLSKSLTRYSPDITPFRQFYANVAAILPEINPPPQMVVVVHEMARHYADFLIRRKLGKGTLFRAEMRPHDDINRELLENIQRDLEGRSEVQRIIMFYPNERGIEYLAWIRATGIKGFTLTDVGRASASHVLQFQRLTPPSLRDMSHP